MIRQQLRWTLRPVLAAASPVSSFAGVFGADDAPAFLSFAAGNWSGDQEPFVSTAGLFIIAFGSDNFNCASAALELQKEQQQN
jgi:hypothetical protein